MFGTQERSGRRVYETIPSSPARLLRITPGYDVSNNEGKAVKEMESGVEVETDRKTQS